MRPGGNHMRPRALDRALTGLVLVAATLVAGVPMTATVATASGPSLPALTWTGPLRLAGDGNLGQARSVACPSATQCTATDNFGREVTFDPTNPGSPTPFMLDPGQNLVAVRCPSTIACVEISSGGRVAMFNPTAPLAPTVTTVDAGAGVGVDSLACPSVSQCTAVDNQGRVLTFDPSAPGTPALITIDSGKQLNDVSCPTSTQCTAVDNGGRELTFNPASPGTPTPVAVTGATSLGAISCPTATQCTAISSTQAVTFDPTNAGSPTATTIDSGHIMVRLSCPTASRCVAIDNARQEITFDPANLAGATTAVVGTSFSHQSISCPVTNRCTTVDLAGQETTFDPGAPGTPTPVLVDGRTPIKYLACPATTQCTAVDDSRRAFTFNPTAFVLPTPATLEPTSTITGIACPSTTQCTAIDGGSHELTFNPASPGTPTPVSMTGNPLTAVACPSSTVCAAVDNSGDRVFFNPTNPVPQPIVVDCCTNSAGNVLNSVSCPSTTQCTAVDNVGQYVTTHPNDAPGSVFPGSIDAEHVLTAVACPSTSQCTAVEQQGGREVTFASSTPANPVVVSIDGSTLVLSSIACTSTTFCVAVDSLGQALEGDPTTANAWLVKAIPQSYSLQAITCPSAWECVATDAMGNAYLGLKLPVNTAIPTISGTAKEGQLLTETNGTWTNSPTGLAYQWQDCDSGGANCVAIAGATASTYTLQYSDAGHRVRVVETASNDAGSGTPATSDPTATVDPLPPTNLSPPTITGTARQGQLLTEVHGSWTNDPTFYGYQWQRCDVNGGSCASISAPEGTAPTYGLTAQDVNHTIRVGETAGNAGGSTAMLTYSDVTAVVAPPDTTAPSLQLTATPSNPSNSSAAHFTFSGSDADSPPVTFSCQLDAAAAAPCTSPYDVSGLSQGTHTVTVTAMDASSNNAHSTYQWLVDTTNPTVQLTTTPSAKSNSSSAAFAFSGSDALTPPVTFTCRLDVGPAAPCTSPASVSGLSEGTHTFTVTAADGAGNSAPTSYQWLVDTTPPTVQLTATPAAKSNSSTAQFTFTGSDTGSPPLSFTCQLDAGAAAPCTSPYDVIGLAEGTHTFAVTATDGAGNSAATSYQWLVDTTAPTVTLKTPTAPFVLTSATLLTWAGSDVGAGVADYQVRYQRAVWNGRMGAWTYPAGWQALTGTSLSAPMPVGYTYCFAVRAVDNAGGASAWSASRCTARPLDDRALLASKGWTRAKAASAYRGTFTQTSTHNATLMVKGVRLDRVGVIVTTCSTCGTVGVYVGTTLVGKINLHSTKTVHKALRMLPAFALKLGNVTLKVLTTGKSVQIDGLAVSEK